MRTVLKRLATWLLVVPQVMAMWCRSKLLCNIRLTWPTRPFMTSQGSFSRYLKYHPAKGSNKPTEKKPRVILFPWLGATKRGIQKYVELYHEQGMDVVEVKCNQTTHFLWPKLVRTVTSEVLPFVKKLSVEPDDTFVVHSASIGAYAYTVFHMDMLANPEYKHLKDRIVGHVFDSIVIGGLQRMATGIATNTSSNKVLQSIIIQTSLLYFGLTKKYTTDFYDEAVNHFRQKLVGKAGSPSLFFYCGNDALADPDAMRDVLRIWREERHLLVLDRYWPISTHAGHLRQHEKEYIGIFKEYIDLVKSQTGKYIGDNE